MTMTKLGMKASMPGTCSACGGYHIQPTQEIVKHGMGWAAPKCAETEEELWALFRNAKAILLKEHQIAFGCWGIASGMGPTFTRLEWLNEAEHHGALSREDRLRLEAHWRPILHRDLLD